MYPAPQARFFCVFYYRFAVTNNDFDTKLQYICQREDREVENDVLRGIARKSHGSVRDAESLLDSALTFSDAPVVMVNDVRWLISAEEVIKLQKSFTING